MGEIDGSTVLRYLCVGEIDGSTVLRYLCVGEIDGYTVLRYSVWVRLMGLPCSDNSV